MSPKGSKLFCKHVKASTFHNNVENSHKVEKLLCLGPKEILKVLDGARHPVGTTAGAPASSMGTDFSALKTSFSTPGSLMSAICF